MITPESTMPTPAPTPRIADSSPMLPATFSRGNSSRTIPKASGKIPLRRPWMNRPTTITASELDTAERSVPAARITSVHRRIFSLPYMSPSRPRIAVPTEAASR